MEAYLGTQAIIHSLDQSRLVGLRVQAMVNQVGPELEVPVTKSTAPGEAGEEIPSKHTLSVCSCCRLRCTAEARFP